MRGADPELMIPVTLTVDTALVQPTLPSAPTYSSIYTGSEPFGEVTHSPVPLSQVPKPACTDCDGEIFGYPGATPTATAAASAATTQAATGGTLEQGSPFVHDVWYQRPWTGPAAYLLAAYSVLSLVAMGILVFSGLMDLKGNVSLSRLQPSARSAH